MFFSKKAPLNNVDPAVCNPIIVNQTNHSIVLFLDRGVLYNKQIIGPGEAVGMTRNQTAGSVMPYRIHAVVGDESSLPTSSQSMRNALSTLVIPTAFIVGTLAAASSAGTLAGPSRALSRAAGGLVVRGMVIDSAALAAGSLSASRASLIADRLIEQYPENYSVKSPLYMPGNRHVVIRGGIEEPLTIKTIKEKEFKRIAIQGELKTPMDTLQEKIEYITPSFLRRSSATEGEDESEKPEAIANQTEQQARGAAPLVVGGKADEAADAAKAAQQEEMQLRKAMAESLRAEEDRKRKDEQYQRRLKESAPIPVVLF
ncbi:expressed unknown protein [Seminavis robusta]|uniref:Uncharacterized protein n=1 Tax=Seminavis robusta TaxID=568900 RepID=A0A9N8EUX9_9STRA|nr:expressed unknown protein [Seminavis robusta]|eukprot:Sro2284_g321890.1 n/a (315) ;mRNA; f:6111-7055